MGLGTALRRKRNHLESTAGNLSTANIGETSVRRGFGAGAGRELNPQPLPLPVPASREAEEFTARNGLGKACDAFRDTKAVDGGGAFYF